MKALLSTATAALMAISFATAANAVPSKSSPMAQHEASCKAQAAKKYSAIHFLKRRDFVNECMGRTAKSKVQHVKTAKVNKKSQTTGQAVR